MEILLYTPVCTVCVHSVSEYHTLFRHKPVARDAVSYTIHTDDTRGICVYSCIECLVNRQGFESFLGLYRSADSYGVLCQHDVFYRRALYKYRSAYILVGIVVVIHEHNYCRMQYKCHNRNREVLSVILSAEGLILFPVFTVYITNALTRKTTQQSELARNDVKKSSKSAAEAAPVAK